jgi:hypothetical protein
MGEAGVLGSTTTTNRNDDGGVGSSGVGVGILQLLIPNQDKLVPILGKKTSWDTNVNKREECATLGYDWVTITGW